MRLYIWSYMALQLNLYRPQKWAAIKRWIKIYPDLPDKIYGLRALLLLIIAYIVGDKVNGR